MTKALDWKHATTAPTIVCLCGSTRFRGAFDDANYTETLAGRIVLSVGFYMHASGKRHGEDVGCTDSQKEGLDELHFRKIEIADEIFVLNVDGYIGQSTQREIACAIAWGKAVRFLEHEAGGAVLSERSHEIGQQVAAFVTGRIPPLPAPSPEGEEPSRG